MSKPQYNTLAAERRKARHYGMQALYQWYMAGASLNDIEAQFRDEYARSATLLPRELLYILLDIHEVLISLIGRTIYATDGMYHGAVPTPGFLQCGRDFADTSGQISVV